ncbi:MAG TPA: metabolite traffic protein EboE, partial [Anseongella sp.]
MLLANKAHLTYCTNIHPGESWKETFAQLKKYLPAVKRKAGIEGAPMGVGLRLSDQASRELETEGLKDFRTWLKRNGFYVFTMNGFPYGAFHHKKVKDLVHHPDWLSRERVDYTLRLFGQLKELLPAGMNGSISTSPLSYKDWFSTRTAATNAMIQATYHILEIAEYLANEKKSSGITLHLDIEPEPDGLLGNTKEFIEWYDEYLLPEGVRYFREKMGLKAAQSKALLKEHIRLCYDICHVAVSYENHAPLLKKLSERGIQIGKLQVSAALKVLFGKNNRQKIKELNSFNEPVYLHQVVARTGPRRLRRFYDMTPALRHFNEEHREWRV